MSAGAVARGVVLLLLGGALGYFVGGIKEASKPVEYVFDTKTFQDAGGNTPVVYVAGTRKGDGVLYPANTMQITCYKDRMVCVTNSIEGISSDTCQLGRLDTLEELPVSKWTDYEIVAAEEVGTTGCRKTTVSIARNEQAVVFVDEPVNLTSAFCRGARTSIEKSTVEDRIGSGRSAG